MDNEKELLEDEKPAEPVYYEPLPEDTEVIGVRFRTSGKVYYFDPDSVEYKEGCHAIVETARGTEYGTVAQSNHIVAGKEIVLPLRKALRVATEEDDLHDQENLKAAEEAFLIGNKKIEEHGLDMKLIDTEYTFDNSKLLFYFTSDGRVDFRELVKDLASVFHCRIELRQMGIRDEAKVLGGLGICGRPFCCHAFLPDFVQVSIKMAKEQNLSLNAAKISGACGRLMCCLRYEYETYLEEGRLTPKVDTLVNTPDGMGVVVEAKPLTGMVKVRALNDSAIAPRIYKREEISPIQKGDDNYEKALLEKAAEQQAKEEAAMKASMKAAKKAAESQRVPTNQHTVQKAASFTDQVLPEALKRSDSELKEKTSMEKSFKERDGKNANRNHRKKGKKNFDKQEEPKTFHSSEKNNDSRPHNASANSKKRKPHHDFQKAPGSNSADLSGKESEKTSRYEKISRTDREQKNNKEAPFKNPALPQTPSKNDGAPQDKQQKKPFRHFKKKNKPQGE